MTKERSRWHAGLGAGVAPQLRVLAPGTLGGRELSVGAALAGPAQATETIESFKTNAREENTLPPPEGLGEMVATGFAQGAPSGEEFTIETAEGEIDTVEVSPSTTYIDPAVSEPRLSDIALGDYITVSGKISGPET